jgi:hypothetical protein
MSPTAKLSEVMSRPVEVAMADQKLAEIDALFATQSGLPVLDGEGRCIGVVSKKDKAKASNGASASVSILFFFACPPLPAIATIRVIECGRYKCMRLIMIDLPALFHLLKMQDAGFSCMVHPPLDSEYH